MGGYADPLASTRDRAGPCAPGACPGGGGWAGTASVIAATCGERGQLRRDKGRKGGGRCSWPMGCEVGRERV